jgi:hypothetical protein
VNGLLSRTVTPSDSPRARRAWLDDQIEAAVRTATRFPDYVDYLPG